MRDPTGLPPWEPRDQRERDALKRWTIAQLDQEMASRSTSSIPNLTTKYLALMAADAGNMQPLRAIYAALQHPGRGKYRRHARSWALAQAVGDVKCIRDIWKLAYGRQKRGDQLAEEIAAERWTLDHGELHRALLQTSRKKRS